MPASLRLNRYSSSVVVPARAASGLRAHAGGEIAGDERGTRKKNSATTFSGSAMVKV